MAFLLDMFEAELTKVRSGDAGKKIIKIDSRVRRLETPTETKEPDAMPFRLPPEYSPVRVEKGALVIPWNCDPRYRWWAGGQSVSETMRELGMAAVESEG